MRLPIPILVFVSAFAGSPAAADEWPTETLIKNVDTSMQMTPVKGGCYKMGGTSADAAENEKPAHEVCVKDFLIGKYEVSQVQWISITGKNPSSHDDCGEGCPVENVSWNDVQEFIRKLSQRTQKTYRLPTEAEWEYAARSGGKQETWAGTSNEKELGDYAWYLSNAKYMSHPIGKKKPNALGLYDMTGNVWEWVADWYAEDYYATSPKENPQGPETGRLRVLRGGYWGDMGQLAQVTRRIGLAPDVKGAGYGFRVVLPAN